MYFVLKRLALSHYFNKIQNAKLESTGLTVQRAVVIVTINPSATMSTDLVPMDALLDTRGLFVLNVNTILP